MTYGQDRGQPYGGPRQPRPNDPAAQRRMQGPPNDAQWQRAPHPEQDDQPRGPRRPQQPRHAYDQQQQGYGQQPPPGRPWQEPGAWQEPGQGQRPRHNPAQPHRRESWPARHKLLTGLIAFAGVIVVGGVAAAVSGPGNQKPVATTPPASAPPASSATTVLLLGQADVALLNSSTHAIVKKLDYNEESPAGGPGDKLVAFVQTSRGLTAYVLEYAQVVPVYLASDTIGQPIQLGGPTWAIAASPDGKTVYVASGATGQDGEVTPIDTAVNGAGQPIPVGVNPDGLAFGPGGKTLYVANAADGTVTPIDVAAGTAGQPISLGQGGGDQPQIVVTPDGKTVYVLSHDQVIPIDATVDTAGTPIALRASPVTVPEATPGNAGLAAPLSASPLVLSPDGATLYDGVAGGEGWTAISTATNTVTARLTPKGENSQILLAPDGRTLYGIDNSGDLIAVDTATNTVTMRVSVGGGDGYSDMAITPDGRTIFLFRYDTLVTFNTVTRTVGKPIKLSEDDQYYAMAVAP
jgi:DNA-binding beta-propeller fold protein YncE